MGNGSTTPLLQHMYMAFIGQTINPWDVPVKKAIKVMQQIWDATNSHKYVIISSTAVYQKVHDLLISGMTFIPILDYSMPC